MAEPNYGLIDNALVNKNRALEGYGAVNALYSQNLQNQADQMAIENAMAEKAAFTQAGGDVAAAQQNLMKLGLGKQSVAIGKAVADIRKLDTEAIDNSIKAFRTTWEGVTTPEQAADRIVGSYSNPIIGPFLRSNGMTPEKSLAMLNESLKTPGGFKQFLQQAQLGTEKMLSHIINEGQLKVSQGNLAVSQGNLAETRRAHDLQYAPNVVANTVTDNAGNVTQFNRYGQIIGTPGKIGKPTAQFEKTENLQKQQKRDLDLAIGELEKATKDGGLIDQSTGSGIGRARDVTAGFFGQSTPGAIAIGKLKPIADLALKMVPRFEGPQSDKDTQSYKEAAGQLADPNLPTDIRKAAGREVLRLMKSRKDQFVSEGMANEGIGPGAIDANNPLLNPQK